MAFLLYYKEKSMNSIVERLRDFMEQEARSCSMDIGGITPLYVYRMWGGAVAIEDIATAMEALRQAQELVRRMM